jgi:hypothetical protein
MKDNYIGEHRSWLGLIFHLAYEPGKFGATEPSISKTIWMYIANTFFFIIAGFILALLSVGIFMSKLIPHFLDEK